MRKQTKIVLAAALFTMGASFSAFAAKTGTWMLEEDGWYCYDSDGDAYEDEFCLSYGKEYYMGDDGLMVTSSWVEYDGDYYYVGSDGAKTINDWRFLTPEDDEDEDAQWYYFGSKGKMVTGKKAINGKTYYFDSEGAMLTGWVDYDSDSNTAAEAGDSISGTLIRCDEEGARMSKTWIEDYAPGVDEEDEDDEDMYWYWIKSAGTVQKGRNIDINGETYFFNTNGQMLYGWVYTADDGDTYQMAEQALDSLDADAVYFCGDSEQGWAKKNTWIKTWNPEDFEDEDADDDQYWYWINKNGKVYIPDAASASSASEMNFEDGSDDAELGAKAAFTATDSNCEQATLKEVNNKTYAFNERGEMLSGLVWVKEDKYDVTNGVGLYYFGGSNDGSMKTGSVTIEDEEGDDYKFFFGKKTEDGYTKGVGVTGAASGELFINGLIQTADDSYEVVEVDGVGTFIVDEDGDIRTSRTTYEDDDDNLIVDASDVEFVSASGVTKGSVKPDKLNQLVKY